MIDDGDEDGDEEDANILLTDFSFRKKLPTGTRQEHIGDGHCFHCQGFTFLFLFLLKDFHDFVENRFGQFVPTLFVAGNADDHQAEQDGGGRYGGEGECCGDDGDDLDDDLDDCTWF